MPWAYQCGRVYEEAAAALRQRFPQAEFRHARYVYEESIVQAVQELLSAGCQTIVYQSYSNPVYSDFEEYAYALPVVHKSVSGQAKIVLRRPGGQPACDASRPTCNRPRDHLAKLPRQSKVLLILSRHGHPFKKETMDVRGPEYRRPLEAAIRRLMAGWDGPWDLVWSNDEYADEYWDPKGTKLETAAAYQMAIDEGFDYALEVPTEVYR